MSEALFGFGLACLFIVIIGTISWLIANRLEGPDRPPTSASSTTGTSPYRTSTPPTEVAKPIEDAKPPKPALPFVIVDWGGRTEKENTFTAQCPACGATWFWTESTPSLCACTKCTDTHFHLKCRGGGKDAGLGCDMKWIMRSALSKRPTETPQDKPVEPEVDKPPTETNPS